MVDEEVGSRRQRASAAAAGRDQHLRGVPQIGGEVVSLPVNAARRLISRPPGIRSVPGSDWHRTSVWLTLFHFRLYRYPRSVRVAIVVLWLRVLTGRPSANEGRKLAVEAEILAR